MQRRLIGISVSLLVFAAALVSQSPATQTVITGTIADQTGAVIPGASVAAKHVPTGTVITGATSGTGNFTLTNLPAGEYTLRAEKPGFKTYTREKIQLADKQVLRFNIVLEVGQATDSITLTADSSMMKTDRATQPSPDAIQEIAISTSNFRAEFGTVGGAIFNQTMRVNGLAPDAVQYRMDGQTGRMIAVAPGTERYGHYVENEFSTPQQEPLSTFSTDVDTASYSNIRRFLAGGSLPPPDSVRVEELINYFRYDYPAPEKGKPVAAVTHLMKSPWNPEHQLLHVGLRTASVASEDLPPSHLTFLVDVSGSMLSPDKLPLVQQSLQMLTRQLRPQDSVALAVYAGAAGMVLPPTRGDRQPEILDAIGRLDAGGSTAGAAGIRLAYQLARQSFDKKANNRVILATDGDFNVGVSNDDELVRLIEEERKSGVFLSVLGFGTGNLQDAKMEKLADHGNGNYAYIDSLKEARKVFVQEMGATLVTVAKDVKLQIEFNPARVKEYRLVGYENRLLRPEDFNNDAKDAGDMGMGHQVTAFYEIIPAGDGRETAEGVDELRYQQQAPRPAANRSSELGWMKLRYKAPQGDRSELLEWPMASRAVEFRDAPRDVRFAAAVAEYGMLLRHSKFAGQASFEHVLATANDAMGQDLDGYRADFMDLARRAANLSGAVISRR